MKALIKALMITALLSGTAFAEIEDVAEPNTPNVETQETTATEHTPKVEVQKADATAHEPATASQMAGIWHSMKWARTEAARINVLTVVAKSYWLSAMQVEVLIETIGSPESRKKLLADFYPRITNPAQIGRLGRLLPSGSIEDVVAVRTSDSSSHL